jgi:hypothetical protein
VAQPAAGVEKAVTRCNYFLGNDPSRWLTDVTCWEAVRLADIAPGVSVDIHGRLGLPEYDLRFEPGREVSSVEVVVEGADGLEVLVDGSVEIATPLGTVRQLPPRAWELDAAGNERPLDARVELVSGDRFRFHVSGRDMGRAAVIDPGLAYATFVEGSASEQITSIQVDATQSAVVGGNTASNDFPVTPGAFQLEKSTWDDGFVAKLSPAGSDLEFATYLGGTGPESMWGGIALTVDGDIVVAGKTHAPDFPTTPGAYSTAKGEGWDAYVTKLNASGSALVFSTYFPGAGSGDSNIDDIALDAMGRIVLGGVTEFAELPITPDAMQPTVSGTPTGFIARMSPDGSSIDYCTYVDCHDLTSVAVDANMAIYATGYDESAPQGLPLTPGAFQPTYMGNNDAFALKLSPTGSLSWCTILGGSDADRAVGIEVDDTGQPVVAGWTRSSNFPSTPGSFDPTHNGDRDFFVVRLASDGSHLVWGTRLGGAGYDPLSGFAMDGDGNSYVHGSTQSLTMPVTPNGYETVHDGGAAYVGKLSADGTTLLYGTFLDVTGERCIAADSQGNAYAAGYTLPTGFTGTPGAFDTEVTGGTGAYVVKIDLSTWKDIGQGLASLSGIVPRLMASGSLQPGSAGSLHVDRAQENSLCTIVFGLAQLSAPFKGGTLVPMPSWLLPFVTDSKGKVDLGWAAFPQAPGGVSLWFQAWISDAQSPAGLTASNGLTATVP